MSRAATPASARALALAIGGALGNVVDRMRHGAVTDFLDLHVGRWHWPAFNAADVGIVFGIAVLLLGNRARTPPARSPRNAAGPPP
jgi:signal peptidase II